MSVKYRIFPISLLHFWHKDEETPVSFSTGLNLRDNCSAAETLASNGLNRSLPDFGKF